jgi:hypothetical protein
VLGDRRDHFKSNSGAQAPRDRSDARLLRQCVDEMEQEEVGSASAAIVGHLEL